MTAMLSRADVSIRMEFFLFGGRFANALIDILAQKRAAGVRVHVTLDSTRDLFPQHRRERDAAYARLRVLGLDVVLSDPRPFPHAPTRRAMSHNKFIVVDDREALIGGMNVGAMFFRYHDVMIHLVGPTAATLGQQFDYDRRCAVAPELPSAEALVETLPSSEGLPCPSSGATMARILGTGVGRRTTEGVLRRHLRTAQRSVCVALSEMGRTDMLDDLIATARQGVAVRVLLCPLHASHFLPDRLAALRPWLPSGSLNAYAVRRLLRAGIPTRLFRVAPEFDMMHLKMSLFDGQTAVVGSTNWTRGGFHWVGETDVELYSGDVVTQLSDQFEVDWQRSDPASLPTPVTDFFYGIYERGTQK
jgi:phosphatidylserine/phosphatidylglycerophosphate/cardiolipin synthase-like enzyme